MRTDLGLDLARDYLSVGPGAAGGVGGVSVALAAAILLAYCGVRALPLHYTVRDLDQEVRLVKHGFIRDK